MKLPVISGKELIKAYGRLGYAVDRQRGSHVIMIKTQPVFKAITIPLHPKVDKGTLHRILADTGVTVRELMKALKKKV